MKPKIIVKESGTFIDGGILITIKAIGSRWQELGTRQIDTRKFALMFSNPHEYEHSIRDEVDRVCRQLQNEFDTDRYFLAHSQAG